MPRRGNIAKREVLPDPLYNSTLVTRLINNIMLDGKKGVAQKIVYDAFDIIKEKTGKEPLEVFEAAMENVSENTKSTPESIVRDIAQYKVNTEAAVHIIKNVVQEGGSQAQPQIQPKPQAAPVKIAEPAKAVEAPKK